MKVEIKKIKDEVFGIELISEDNENDILERFWIGGLKINVRGHNSLQLTFADLIEK